MMLTYAIYRNVPPLSAPAFGFVRNQGVIEQFDALRTSANGQKIWLKWRGLQPTGLIPGLVLWTGNHAEALQEIDDSDNEWTSPI